VGGGGVSVGVSVAVGDGVSVGSGVKLAVGVKGVNGVVVIVGELLGVRLIVAVNDGEALAGGSVAVPVGVGVGPAGDRLSAIRPRQ
jgi:hypothetical protein